jgi:hypothetical protein
MPLMRLRAVTTLGMRWPEPEPSVRPRHPVAAGERRRPAGHESVMRRRKLTAERELTDADLQILTLAAQLERDGRHADLVELIRSETDRGRVTVADTLRMNRLVRRRDAGIVGDEYERWAVAMLTGRLSDVASWW